MVRTFGKGAVTLALLGLGLVQAVVILGVSGVAVTRLLIGTAMIGLGYGPLLLVAAVLAVVYLGAAVAPLVGVVATGRSLVARLGLVLVPSAVFGAAHAIAVAVHMDGSPPPPAPPPADCRPAAVDASQRLRPCTAGAGSDSYRGDCPADFTCRAPIGQSGPPVCFIPCSHDCMCPATAKCVNAACQFPGDPLP
jgi:hypothetical protein